jgi:MFS family permease
MSYLRGVAADRPIRLVLLASFVNTFGTGLYAATYVTFALRSDVSAAALSGALAIGALIAVFGAPSGAWAAERFGSRNLSISINVLRALANVLLVIVGPWWFVAVVLTLSVADRFAFPASQTVLASVAARGDKALVLSVRQLTQTGGLAMGAVAAAGAQLLMPRDMLWVLIVANAATFAINAWLFARLPAETGPPCAQPLPWHVGWPPRGFLVALLMSALVDCAGMAVELALPLFAFEHHQSLVRWVGTAIALQYIMGVVVTAILGRVLNMVSIAPG